MQFVHKRCGGRVDINKRRCLRCRKKWNPVSFLITTELRPIGTSKPSKERRTYAKWADKIPGTGSIASLLPNWPRWARILATTAFVCIVVLIVYLVRR